MTSLERVADLVIRRVVTESSNEGSLAEELERAYPFGDLVEGRTVWRRALQRHGLCACRAGRPSEYSRPASDFAPPLLVKGLIGNRANVPTVVRGAAKRRVRRAKAYEAAPGVFLRL